MTGLATGSAPIGLHTMLGLVDGEYRRSPTLVVAEGALLVAFQGSVGLCECGKRAEKYRNAGTDQKKPNQFAHLFPSRRESGSLLLTFRTEHLSNPGRAELRNGQVYETGVKHMAAVETTYTSHKTGLERCCM